MRPSGSLAALSAIPKRWAISSLLKKNSIAKLQWSVDGEAWADVTASTVLPAKQGADGPAHPGEDPVKPDGPGASFSIDQVWSELAKSNEAWEYDGYYYIGVPTPITYKMTFDDGVPITGHDVKFLTTSITGWEWNPEIEIDDNDDGEPEYVGAYDEDVTYTSASQKLQAGGVYSGLVAYTPTVRGTGESAGKYLTSQTVKDYIGPEEYVDFYTDSVEFDVTDNSALKRK